MKIEQYSRLIHHRLTSEGVRFTNPTSNDHTDGTWSPTDLYIGEIGINVTDDKMYFRTNNGIIEVGSSASFTPADIWVFVDDNIEIGPSYSTEAITRNGNSYTDLGTSDLRFGTLYLGGSPETFSIIDVADGFRIIDVNGELITTESGGTSDSAIIIAEESSGGSKNRPLHLNSISSYILGDGSERTIISSADSVLDDATIRSTIISATDIKVENSSNVVYIGDAFGRTFSGNNSLVVGGSIINRAVSDDGSSYYAESENIRSQAHLTTTDGNSNSIFNFAFNSCGEVFTGKFTITGVDITNAGRIYSVDLFFTISYDGSSVSIIADPIRNEISSMDSADVNISESGNTFDVNVVGEGSTTIKWLLSYEYHRIINVC